VCGKSYSDLRQHIRLVHEGHKVQHISHLRLFYAEVCGRLLALIGVLSSLTGDGWGGDEIVICTVMEPWTGGPYRLPWQVLLS